jgi:Protein of unknown function (DUF1203)
MSFRITGLDPEPFRPLFGLSEEALAAHGARRLLVDDDCGFPDRVELRDLSVGETALLLNFIHQPAATPYRSCHAIFVREGAVRRYDAVDEIPEVMRGRTLSLRAFDLHGDMVDADLVEGRETAALIERFLGDPGVAYLHAHYARRGCYAARIERA